MKTFRIYKTEVSRIRKDGSRLVKSYGCDGKSHFVTYDRIYFDINGKASNGIPNIKPPKYIGKCEFSKVCKNLGFFSI